MKARRASRLREAPAGRLPQDVPRPHGTEAGRAELIRVCRGMLVIKTLTLQASAS